MLGLPGHSVEVRVLPLLDPTSSSHQSAGQLKDTLTYQDIEEDYLACVAQEVMLSHQQHPDDTLVFEGKLHCFYHRIVAQVPLYPADFLSKLQIFRMFQKGITEEKERQV